MGRYINMKTNKEILNVFSQPHASASCSMNLRFQKQKSQCMKLKILAPLIFCFIIQSCKENITEVNSEVGMWTKVESGVTSWLRDIDFTDYQNGWIVGDSGVILNTEDGGETWGRQICPINEILIAVDFVDTSFGWICSRNSILKTTNGGESWEIKYTEDLEDGYFLDIQFLNKNTGFAVGGRGSFASIGVLLKTNDGGETWQQASLNRLPRLTHISIVDEQNIWICGFGGTILYTTDVGLSWIKGNFNISPRPSLTTIQFMDQYNGWAGSRDDWLGFYLTTDGGDKWIRISEDSFKIVCGVLSFYFIDKNRGWMCNFPFDRILRTSDGGLTWQYDSEIRQRINSFHFLGNETGWAVGNYGGILKYSENTDLH